MSPILTKQPARLLLGLLLIAIMVGWISYRMSRRLAVEPYVDFNAFYLAAEAARTGGDPYRVGTEMYIYPPMLASFMAPLSLMSQTNAAWLWYALSMTVTLFSLFLLWVTIQDAFHFKPRSDGFFLALAVTLLFWHTQFRWEFEQGQTDWLMLAGLCIALRYLDRAPPVVGLALGFAINIKYLPLAIVAYLIVRKRWREVGWTFIGIVAWALIPALIYGWDRNLVLLGQGVSGLAKIIGITIERQAGYVFPITYDRSVTIPSAFARIGQSVGYGLPFVALLTGVVGGVTLAVLAAIYRRFRVPLVVERGGKAETIGSRRSISFLEVTVILAFMLAFSPQAMLRHYFLVCPLVMLAATLAVQSSSRMCIILAWTALAFGLLGSVGADLLTVFGMREEWKYFSGLSICTILSGLITLTAGLTQLESSWSCSSPTAHSGPELRQLNTTGDIQLA